MRGKYLYLVSNTECEYVVSANSEEEAIKKTIRYNLNYSMHKDLTDSGLKARKLKSDIVIE